MSQVYKERTFSFKNYKTFNKMVKIGHTILISLSLYLLTNANPLSNDQKLVENSGAGIVEGDIKLQLVRDIIKMSSVDIIY